MDQESCVPNKPKGHFPPSTTKASPGPQGYVSSIRLFICRQLGQGAVKWPLRASGWTSGKPLGDEGLAGQFVISELLTSRKMR